MQDICKLIKSSKKSGKLEEFISDYCGDPAILISVSSKPIKIKKKAVFDNGYNSLIHIYDRAFKTNNEIPYTGIFDCKDMTVYDFVKGKMGSCGSCDWEKGNLMEKTYSRLTNDDHLISLGHTHPPGFGAICSDVKYGKQEIIDHGGSDSEFLLETKIYEIYGGDYCEMLARTKNDRQISSIFSIMAPKENQLGFFEIKDKGRVVYHPWKIID